MMWAIFSVGLSLLAPVTPWSRNRMHTGQSDGAGDRAQPTNIVQIKRFFMGLY